VTEVFHSEAPQVDWDSMVGPNSVVRAVIKLTFGDAAAEAEAFLDRLPEMVEAQAKRDRIAAAEMEQRIRAAPEIEGIEKLLIDTVGHHPQWARIWAHHLHRLGSTWAEEINDGRRASAIIGQLAKMSAASSLVISRRAKALRELRRSSRADVAIERAIKETTPSMTVSEFNALVAEACRREEAACASLPKLCELLRAGLSDPRGRPISEATGVHVFVRRHLKSFGFEGAYTYSSYANDDYANGSDFVDDVTKATRLAMKNPRFSPQHATTLLKSDALPSVEPIASANRAPRVRSAATRKRKPTN